MKKFLFFVLLGSALFSREIPWSTDLDKACEQAKKEKKVVLLAFMASDWCYWCQKMEEDFLRNDCFIQKVKPYFVFVLVDVSRKLSSREKIWTQEYEIQGYPTLVLLTPEKKIIAKVGYQKVSAQKYAKMLIDLAKK